MPSLRTRYPGAQPFGDDEVSSAVFFGRDVEIPALTDEIIAHRLVIFFARSGTGKTSLLKAGVSPHLRREGFVPLMVRVNNVSKGPMASMLETLETSAQRHGLEYRAGDDRSLWHFFKTAEFWRGDLLLTPVLILDQFEELFMLYDTNDRDAFIAELGYLVRGIRPGVKSASGNHDVDGDARFPLSESPPVLRIVISMREDFIGCLEETAERIPQILDHRFRLAPLTEKNALLALHGPCSVDHGGFASRPFRYSREAEEAIISYLSRRYRPHAQTDHLRHVEPFQLQLVCLSIENLALKRQRQGQQHVEITPTDFGGFKGLARTLRSFYTDVLHSIPSLLQRRRVMRLCTHHLISPSGRRLSMEENEIERATGLEHDMLSRLVNQRLLRCEQHAQSIYYEISHDSLVEPILAAARVSMAGSGMLGVAQLLVGVVLCALSLMMGSLLSWGLIVADMQPIFWAGLPIVAWTGLSWMRKGAIHLNLALRTLAGPHFHANQHTPWFWAIAIYAVGLLSVTTASLAGYDRDFLPVHVVDFTAAVAFGIGVVLFFRLHARAVWFFMLSVLLLLLSWAVMEGYPHDPADAATFRLMDGLEIALNTIVTVYAARLQRLRLRAARQDAPSP